MKYKKENFQHLVLLNKKKTGNPNTKKNEEIIKYFNLLLVSSDDK